VSALKQSADSLRHALEFRRLLEPEAAALAASRAGSRERIQVRQAHTSVAEREESDDSAFMAADTAFHLELARSTRNPLIVRSVEQVLTELAPALQALPESGAWHNRSIVEHEQIVRAVMDGRPSDARALMLTHIASTERAIEVLLDGLVTPRRRTAPAHRTPPAARKPPTERTPAAERKPPARKRT
jgi:DNA-binding FadR family transcriptional regulator